MNPARRVAQPVESQADIAYRQIYQLILASRENEGVVWFERQLGEELQLGRTPVREALKRLQQEGLLIPVSAHGGLTAATISNPEVEDVYRLRAVLEAFAAELAAGRSGAGELPRVALDELSRRAEEIEDRAAMKDLVAVSEANHRFHEYVAVLADNPFLREALNKLWSRIQISSMSNFVDDNDWIHEVLRHHDQIVALIIDGDAEGAARVTRHHIDRAREVYVQNHQLDRVAGLSRVR